MKRILVTGGAGFLGRHLCARLLARGDEVICLDNFYTGQRRNVLELKDHPAFRVLEHDICLPFHVDVDEIYNLACPASPIHYQRDPVQTIRTNIQGALNVLSLAARVGARVLQASTSEVYGDPLLHPQPESYWGHVNPFGARSCYDEGKRCAESLFYAYRQQHNVQIKVARLFNTYGPYMHEDDGRVVSNFVVQALRGAPITLYGEGTQTRSFCYVTDLIEGLLRFMDTNAEVTGPMNLGNPREFTVLELAHMVKRMTKSRSEIVISPLPHDDPRQRRPDITYANARLDWLPRVHLEEGLAYTIRYFERLLFQLPSLSPTSTPQYAEL